MSEDRSKQPDNPYRDLVRVALIYLAIAIVIFVVGSLLGVDVLEHLSQQYLW